MTTIVTPEGTAEISNDVVWFGNSLSADAELLKIHGEDVTESMIRLAMLNYAKTVVAHKDTHEFDARGPFLQLDDGANEDGLVTLFWVSEARPTEHAAALFEAFTRRLILQVLGGHYGGFREYALHPEVR